MSRNAIVLAALSTAALFAFAASPAQAAEGCRLEKGDGYIVHLNPAVARQGGALTLFIETLGGEEDRWGGSAAPGCFKGWKSSVRSVKVSADGKVSIGADTPAGTKVRLTARAPDKEIAAEFVIVGKDEVVLTGNWAEAGNADCPLSETPLRELRFKADGAFDATWMPFERYVDYWGTYGFDPATGALSMKPTGGNHVPADADLDGKAEMLADGRLKVTGIFFGSPARGRVEPATCYVFKK